MSSDVLYCFESESVEEVSEKMRGWWVRRLPVVSRDKRLIGTVSLGDLTSLKGQPRTKPRSRRAPGRRWVRGRLLAVCPRSRRQARPRLPQHHDEPVVWPDLSNPAGGPPQCRAGVHHNHIFELFRRLAEAAEQRRKPQPTQTVYAPARWNGSPRRTKLAEPLRRSATAIHRRQPRRAIKELHRWRPDRAIAARERALRLPDHTPLASRPVAIVEPHSRPAHGQ